MLKVIGMRVGARESVTSKCNVLMTPHSRAIHAGAITTKDFHPSRLLTWEVVEVS